jgi:HEAT repeat protein
VRPDGTRPARGAIVTAVVGAVLVVVAAAFLAKNGGVREVEEPLPTTVRGRPLNALVAEALDAPNLDVARANGKELSLAGVPAVEVLPQLREALREPGAQRATAAAIMIGRLGIGGSEAVPDLVARLADPSPSLRQECALALGYMGPRAAPAVEGLTRLLADPAQPIRLAAVSALGEIGAPAAPALGALLELARTDPDLLVRAFAAAAARRIGPAPASPAGGSHI